MSASFTTVKLPPPPEFGIHKAVYATAAKLCDSGATYESAVSAILQWRAAFTFRRPVPNRELIDATNSAYQQLRQQRPHIHTRGISGDGLTSPSIKWPKPDPAKRAQIIDPDFGLYDLWEASPVRFEDRRPHTRDILRALFPGDPLVYCGWSMTRFETKRLSEWKHIESMQFLVPNPMSKPFGKIQNSERLSARSKDNTGDRRFLVIDYDDSAGADVHASASGCLSQYYPLALVLSSGGKSLHAWYYVANANEGDIRTFMARACLLGGDSAMFNKSQFCRMPDGLRVNGRMQTVYHFNPGVLK